MKAKHGVILMSAILPTTGHIDLIRFAADHGSLYGCEAIHVIVNTRTKEPGYDRRASWILDSLRLQPLFSDNNIPVHVYDDLDDGAPQNPGDHPDFWNFWAGKIRRIVEGDADFVVYASEYYGTKLAETLNGVFVPFDIAREMNDARGTKVRQNIYRDWGAIAQGARRSLVTRVVLFGQESVGKTTVGRGVGEAAFAEYLHEYARPYLETVGADLTEDKMANIFCGQLAAQNLLFRDPKKPIQILDTDILSTYGYYVLKGMPVPDYVFAAVRDNLADLYVVMPDNIPFEADPLRYGGDKRESTMGFWIDILKEVGAKYVVVPETLTTLIGKRGFVFDEAYRLSLEKVKPFINFKRD